MKANIDYVREQIEAPDRIMEAIAVQLDRLDEAKKLIDEKGLFIKRDDLILVNPAVKMERNCTKFLASVFRMYKKNNKTKLEEVAKADNVDDRKWPAISY